MLKSKEFPRVTNFLRAYSDVCAPWAKNIQDDPNDLIVKRKEVHDQQTRLYSLEGATDYLIENSYLSKDEVKKLIYELLALAKAIVGSDAPVTEMDSASIFLMELFCDCDSLSNKQSLQVKNRFGTCSTKVIQNAFEVVKKIKQGLKENALNEFNKSGFPIQNPSELESEEFGTKFKFNDFCDFSDSSYFLPSSTKCEDSENMFEKLSFQFNEKKGSTVDSVKPNIPPPQKFQYDYSWLKSEISNSFSVSESSKVPTSDIINSIIGLLKSAKSNGELENELFDLLGFECYELIRTVLLHRSELSSVSSRTNEEMAQSKNNFESMPASMRQVTIQSESEKRLNKQIRKDEKKIQKLQSAQPVSDNEFPEFDPQHMKLVRELQLEEARNAPLFSKPGRVFTQKQLYPNVYDSYAEVCMSAAFISGRKLNLPENHHRINNAIFEEISIPAVQRVSGYENWEQVSICALDPIGQKAFEGMEQLNLIQSKVFDIAYNTNENMLVCAPTGAGKTNVAMLTIIHEIKNNIDRGVIRKERFKIVYVAPMKALASEMVRNFSKRLKPLGIQVKELTGDMQLTKTEIMQTQILVTTPEKWDVVTRKSTGDVALTQLVKLLILDEVHLLDGDRGPVLEALVARTLRQVETSQSMIRILGLSATLPNYLDVSRFLRVNPMIGLFFFDDRFRPVPLSPTFVGVKAVNPSQQVKDMNDICFTKVVKLVERGHQVMVFVHSRNSTVSTARALIELAMHNGQIMKFQDNYNANEFAAAQKQIAKSRNKELREIFDNGFAIHHAGMLRHDRNLVEKYFREGLTKVLVCTSTLAWGVNLPARAVIIKGTEVYDSKHGSFVHLGVLDVMQIFGRAGRPQYDKKGQGTIITAHNMLNHYLSLLTRQHQIESQFEKSLADNLNAEIALGTVTNVDEGVEWLSYTYFYIRMMSNPHAYGLKPQMLQDDCQLLNHRKDLIRVAAKALDQARMIRYEERTGYLYATDLGRTASHFYISSDTVNRFQEHLKKTYMHDNDILNLVSMAEEYDQLKVRPDELVELDRALVDCYLPVNTGVESREGKVHILLQLFLSRCSIDSFSLASDQAYVIQNATRILRFLFEASLRKGWAIRSANFLNMCKMFERQQWGFKTPLRQFPDIGYSDLEKLDNQNISIERMMDMDSREISAMCRVRNEKLIKNCLHCIPKLLIESSVQPITDRILRLTVTINQNFIWNDKVHGAGSEAFWIWIEDPETDHIYHFEYFLYPKRQVLGNQEQKLSITIPVGHNNTPTQYLVRVISDKWLGSDETFPIDFKKLILPHHHQPQTALLDLQPLPRQALHNPEFEQLYNFHYFNPIQTQIFHTLYHTDHNVLLGAPTGSGKTIAAEIAMFRVFQAYPKTKIVYIAPLKALVRERIEDWNVRFVGILKKKVVELTGDVTPDVKAIAAADIIVTTPEKWDGVSRSWQTRNYVQAISLMVIDEIHLLGENRGPVLEVIVTRTNYISAHTDRKVRIIGLSTALSNAQDLAGWLHINEAGLYNFAPSVRPVPLEVHVSGYPGKHYCPRMATMNKPTYQAIRSHSPDKPTLVFVSSRRQTRLTALDLIAYLAREDDQHQWLHLSEEEIQRYITIVRDQNLKLTLAFGIGLHHAGLHERDRKLVEQLFLDQKIQVLIATSTLAWGVNLPAHLVVIKGTEYFDGKTQRYVDFPITDVLQMMGRAGRPQFDTEGVAVVLVQDIKKNFYKKFLYEPFPVESSLIPALPDHLNAEIVAGTITSRQDCIEYITWTYFFRRLLRNPSFYALQGVDDHTVNQYLSELVNNCLNHLMQASCISVDDENHNLTSTVLGRIASYYYLSFNTLRIFSSQLGNNGDIDRVLWVLCEATEYDELPVRHNEDSLNEDLSKDCRIEVNPNTFDSSHTKANLLLQAHFSRLQLPCSDYYTDLKSILDQAIRVMQAIIDISADRGWLSTAISSMMLLQMILQACWYDDNPLLSLPHVEEKHLHLFQTQQTGSEGSRRNRSKYQLFTSLPELIHHISGRSELLSALLRNDFQENQINEIFRSLTQLPMVSLRCAVKGFRDGWKGEQSLPVRQHKTDEVGECHYQKLHADQQYVLNINLSRLNKQRKDSKAVTPRFTKQKDEGWFLVLGIPDTKELVAMKRIQCVSRDMTHQLAFFTPEEEGRIIYTLYLISDSYVGLDQQYNIYVDVIEKSEQQDNFSEEENIDMENSGSEESLFDSDDENEFEFT